MERILILLVEDDEGHVELIKRAFMQYTGEFAFFTANSIAAAKEKLSKITPDLIIADLNLPDGKCYDIIQFEKYNTKYPFIVMTSHGDEQSAVLSIKAGALDYITKSRESMEGMPWAAKRAIREWKRIEEHEKTIQALRHNEEKYRTLVEQASDVIFTLDLKGNFSDMNSSGVEMLQFSEDEIVKLNINSIILYDEDAQKKLNLDNLKDVQTEIVECYLRCKDSSTIPVEISFRRFVNDKKTIGIARNITIRKLQEIQGKRKSEEIERFNRLAVGRELRMIELKKEINGLLTLLGQNEKYRLHRKTDVINNLK